MARVLITGGTGFLGSSLALQHLGQGDQVIALARQATDAERQNATAVCRAGGSVVEGDVRDRDLQGRCLDGVDLVYHVAAAMREATLSEAEFWDINVGATESLLAAAARAGVKRFVYCSSIGALGKSPVKPADETTPCRPQDIYQRTKKIAEERCLAFHHTSGLPLTIIRPADVYGPRDRRLLKLFRAIKRHSFAMLGSGRNEHHMVYIDDLVAGFLKAASVPAARGEVFIIAGPRPVTLNELAATIARQLRVPPPRLHLPLWPVRTAASLVEHVCARVGVEPPIYERRVDFFRTDYAFDISKARRLLDFQPTTTLDAGIGQTLRWYQEQRLL